MEIEIRVKVTAELCCETARNAAYYKSGRENPRNPKEKERDFWVNLNGNFLDMAALSWCFIFGDKKAEFRWQKLIDDKDGFMLDLLDHLDCTIEQFDEYILRMRTYRDKRIAHRDRYLSDSPRIQYPDLDLAVRSVCFLFQKLCKEYPVMDELFAIKNLDHFYDQRLKHGNEQYHA